MTSGAVLCGFYGRHNLGDEGILAGLVDLLAEARPGEPPLVLSADPAATRREHGVAAVPARRAPSEGRLPRDRAGLVRTLLSRRDFVLGGGDLLRDSPSQDVVASWVSRLELAQRLRRRTAVIGISVGDLWRPSSVERIRSAFHRVDFVVVRDDTSRQRLVDLDLQTTVHVAPDLALRLFPRAPVRARVEGAPRVLVSVRGLADREDSTSAIVHRRALRQLADALDVLARDGAQVELVPLRSLPDRLQPVDDDYVASLELAHLAECGHRFTIHRHIDSVRALRDLLTSADLVVGMRLHAVIMAAGLGVPAVALSYDAKVTQFCADVGVDDCIPSDQVDTGWVVEAARRVLATGPSPQDSPPLAAYRARERVAAGLLADWH